MTPNHPVSGPFNPRDKERRLPTSDLFDRPLLVGLAILYGFIHLVTLGRIYSLHIVDQLDISATEMIGDRLLGWTVGFAFILLIVWFTRQMLRRGWSVFSVLGVHLAVMLPLTYLWYVIFNRLSLWFCATFTENCAQGDTDLFYGYLYNIDRFVMTYLLVLAVTYTYYYLRLDNQHRLSQSQLETKVLQAKMKMLRAQLHPHFLFNTLNSITSLVDFDQDRAKIMLVDLADLLRKVLDWKDSPKVSLGEELELLKRYVDIEKVRFSDDLQVSWSIDETLTRQPVPGMLLQPLVENAIHHGFARDFLDLHIHIEAQQERGQLILRVSDNGQGFPAQEADRIFEQGTGLQNTRERLRTLYGDQFQFTVRNTEPGVCCEIILPLEKP
jgi:signal transduction histidine kinase